MLEAFGVERSLSATGRPHDSTVDESADGIPRARLSGYVHRYDNFRIHSTLGRMSPVELRETGPSLPESSK